MACLSAWAPLCGKAALWPPSALESPHGNVRRMGPRTLGRKTVHYPTTHPDPHPGEGSAALQESEIQSEYPREGVGEGSGAGRLCSCEGIFDSVMAAVDHARNRPAIAEFWQVSAKLPFARQWNRPYLGPNSTRSRHLRDQVYPMLRNSPSGPEIGLPGWISAGF
jgi:hypothetical protein